MENFGRKREKREIKFYANNPESFLRISKIFYPKRRFWTGNGDPTTPGFEPRTSGTTGEELPARPPVSSMPGSVYFARHIVWV